MEIQSKLFIVLALIPLNFFSINAMAIADITIRKISSVKNEKTEEAPIIHAPFVIRLRKTTPADKKDSKSVLRNIASSNSKLRQKILNKKSKVNEIAESNPLPKKKQDLDSHPEKSKTIISKSNSKSEVRIIASQKNGTTFSSRSQSIISKENKIKTVNKNYSKIGKQNKNFEGLNEEDFDRESLAEFDNNN